MLVLSRKATERLRLGDSIVITIVQINGDKVRLGIEAPPNVRVLRDELEEFTPPNPARASCTQCTPNERQGSSAG
jgi:carbon storage regulator